MIALAYIFCSVSAGKNEIGVCAQLLPAFVADKRFDKFSPALFYPGRVKKGLKPTQNRETHARKVCLGLLVW